MPEWLDTGDHASRPAATAVAVGALYSCTDHALVYQSDGAAWSTWATLGGDVSSHLADAADAHDASAISVLDTAANFTGTDVEAVLAELQDNIDAAGGSGGIDTIYTYPQQADLTGDSTHFTVATGWADANTAYDAATIEGGSFYKLSATGTAQTSTKRFTLASSKAGAFTVDTLIYPDFDYWAGGDINFAIVLANSLHSRIAAMQVVAVANSGGTNLRAYGVVAFANGTISNQNQGLFDKGEGVTFRIVRDGSNNLTFFWGIGANPAVLHQLRLSTTNGPVTVSQTGTVEEIDLTMTTVTGNAAAEYNAYVDYIRIA